MNKVIEKNEKTALTTVQKIAKASDDFETKLSAVLNSALKTNEEIVKANKIASDEYVKTLESLASKQNELDSLKEEYDKKLREANYDLSMKVKEDEASVFAKLIESRGVEIHDKGTIGKLGGQIKSLEEELAIAKKNNEAAMVKAIEEAVEKARQIKNLEFQAEKAELVAENSALSDKLTAANERTASLELMIKEERTARVEEAKARGGEKIQITNTK